MDQSLEPSWRHPWRLDLHAGAVEWLRGRAYRCAFRDGFTVPSALVSHSSMGSFSRGYSKARFKRAFVAR
ncbi:hypothetical protein [Halorhodospira halochloris]|uniref:hypothetical protein n=1 Tax=Halorhodospira halochloris TaxID=1052 RepID=UPI0013A57C7D|nr:hypothetical protein [Halorhodospira halochloris]